MSEQTFMRFEVELTIQGFPNDDGDALAQDVKQELEEAVLLHFDPKRIVSLTIKETTE